MTTRFTYTSGTLPPLYMDAARPTICFSIFTINGDTLASTVYEVPVKMGLKEFLYTASR
jgi:hypothetical protein